MMRVLHRTLLSSVIVGCALGVLACQRSPQPTAIDRLHPCATDEGPGDAYCGRFPVFENRQARTGRQISLKIVVLPAVSNNPKPDPLVFLAGGPGQAAAEMAATVKQVFARVQRNRDVVLIDQRGTGKSHPLDCRDDRDTLRSALEPAEQSMERLRKCLAGFDADVRLYTTPIAMDDLDDVRAWLGYQRVNLYGGSYGTRAALVYMRQHGDHVRASILDSVAPTDMRLPLYAARDAQRALDKLLSDCDADAKCHAQYPDLRDRVRALMQRLDRQPVRAHLVHPRTGIAEDVNVDARFVSTVMFGALYSPMTASILPVLLDRAEHDDFQGLLALGLSGDGEGNVSVGMQLSVLCSEDYPRVSQADLAQATSGTIFGANLFTGQMQACEFWPKGHIDPSYYEPVVSDIPTLILSGDLDPVTPPAWGQSVAEHLRHVKHVQVPASGHGVIGTACGWQLVQAFLESANPDALDASCATTTHRPPFFLAPSGPDPTIARRLTAR